MRLTLSLGLWLTALIVLVLGVHGWVQLKREEVDLTSATRRELTLVATAVRSAVENAVRDDQEMDVVALLEQLELRDPTVDVFVFQRDGVLLGSSWGSDGNVARAHDIARRAEVAGGLQIDQLASGEFVAIAPLQIRGAFGGHLVILRPTIVLHADLAAELHAIFLSIGLLVAVLLSVVFAVVHLRIHRPINRVIAGVRRVAEGDLSARIDLPGRDEVAELAREFDAMAEALEQARHQLADQAEEREKLAFEMQWANRMAIVGEIAATLAHEIGSPLQVLNGRARDLAARADLPDDARRSATILVEQTERVDHIVGRLLDVARRKAPQLEEFDIRLPVQRIVELLSTHARRMGVRIEVESQSVAPLRGDPAQVQQVLLNLLQNALRASRQGQIVRIAIESSSFRLPGDSKDQPAIAIVVEDAGAGIPEEIRGQIFEPFFTAWDSEPKPRGTGLGLAVVKSIVAEHGGIVSAATPPAGVGARVIVHFPLEAAPTAEVVEAR